MLKEEVSWEDAYLGGLIIPKPLSLGGRDSKSHSTSLNAQVG